MHNDTLNNTTENLKLLTIIIPAYNMENYLRKCCESLLIGDNQGLLEILVINDGSSDATSEIAHEFQDKYPESFRAIDKENGNYGSCINRGLAESTGFFVKVLDADDTFDNAEFACYVRFLSELRASGNETLDMVVTDMLVVDKEGNPTGRKTFSLPDSGIFDLNKFRFSELRHLGQHNITYRTEMLRNIGYVQTEGISYTDAEWAQLPLMAVRGIAYYPHIIYRYLVGRSGQTMEPGNYKKNIWMGLEISKNMLSFYEKRGELCPKETRETYRKFFCYVIADHAYPNYLLRERSWACEKEIIDFDAHIKNTDPTLYDEIGQARFKKWFPVKYIAYWRNGNKWRYKVTCSVYDFLRNIKHIGLKK